MFGKVFLLVLGVGPWRLCSAQDDIFATPESHGAASEADSWLRAGGAA